MKDFSLSVLILPLLLVSCGSQPEPSLKNIPSPAGAGSELPFLTSDQSGSTYLSWVEPTSTKGAYTLKYSQLNDDTWSTTKTIASGESWFINWADYPSVIANDETIIAAHALNKKPGNTYSYDVNIFLNGKNSNWSEPITPHQDSTATEHGFVSMAPWNDKILAIWLDGRRTAGRTEEQYFDMEKAMTLRSAVINTNGTITKQQLIDDSVCDCCNTDIAATANGAIAAYRNRTDDEIRDIYVSRFNGESWSEPASIHNDSWKIAACPVNGPSVAAAGSTAAVAWYTAADGKRMVKAAISTDYGRSFGEPVIISNQNPIGRVQAVMDAKGNAYISWMEKEDSETSLKVKAITANKDTTKSAAITKINGSRKSGFPQMAITDNRLIFAWTQVDSTTSVKTASYPLLDLEL